MRLENVKAAPPSRIIDQSGRPAMENYARYNLGDSLTSEEQMMMKKYNWDIKDIMVLRQLNTIKELRAPDNGYFPD